MATWERAGGARGPLTVEYRSGGGVEGPFAYSAVVRSGPNAVAEWWAYSDLEVLRAEVAGWVAAKRPGEACRDVTTAVATRPYGMG